MSVINIDDYRPHMSGPVRCIQCGHEWDAIAPIGTSELQCPECLTYKGVWLELFSPDPVFECNCGNRLFYQSVDGPVCGKCGVTHDIHDR